MKKQYQIPVTEMLPLEAEQLLEGSEFLQKVSDDKIEEDTEILSRMSMSTFLLFDE